MTLPGAGIVPIPDPSTLTTAIVEAAKTDLRREAKAQRKLDSAKRKLVLAKLTAECRLRKSEHGALVKVVAESATAAEKALTAALTAANELHTAQATAATTAADKQAEAFTKQIDRIADLITTSGEAQSARTDELRGRLDRGEGQTQAVDKSGARTLALTALAIAAISALSAVAGTVFTIVAIATHGKF